jgi:4-amino-4-deoxy-L-arabinose transferase-like glycosyltransferase
MSVSRATAPPDPERLSSLLYALAEIAIAALLVRAEGAFIQEHGLLNDLLVYGNPGFTLLNPNEARLFLAHAVAGVPAALMLTDAATRLLVGRPAPWSRRVIASPRIMAVLLAVVAGIAAEVIASLVLHHAAMNDDERVYLFQARQLLAGDFSSPRPPLGPQIFTFEFVFPVPGSTHWAGAYPPGQPLLLALGMLLHLPHVTQSLCAAGIVYITARFALDLWGAETSVIAGALLVTSPFLLCTAATLHNAVPATFFLLLALRSASWAMKRGRRRDYALVGVGVGAALLCRPYDAAVVGFMIGIVLLIAAIRHPIVNGKLVGTSGLALTVVGALPFLLFFLSANRAVTGDPFMPAYSLWLQRRFPGARTVGFGPTAFAPPAMPYHTPQVMFSKGLVVLSRLSTWLFGWPLSFWPLLAMLLGIGRDKHARLLLVVLGVHFVAYALYTLNAVQDVGSPYHLVEAPILALLSARAIVALGQHLNVFGERMSMWPGRFGLMCGLIGLLTFWPAELKWLHRTALSSQAPVEAATKAADGKPALVFWNRLQPVEHFRSWVFFPPLPGPAFDDPLLWVTDSASTNAAVIAAYPDRRPLRLEWAGDSPRVVPYPAAP